MAPIPAARGVNFLAQTPHPPRPPNRSLPAFQFSDGAPLAEQMAELFSRPAHADVARCVARYGAGAAATATGAGAGVAAAAVAAPDLAAGIAALCARVEDLRRFPGAEHAFEVILHGLRSGQTEERRAPHVQQAATVGRLLEELRREVPRTYLHFPDAFRFSVDGRPLRFRYWMERLVEFTEFNVVVGATVPWKQNFEVR